MKELSLLFSVLYLVVSTVYAIYYWRKLGAAAMFWYYILGNVIGLSAFSVYLYFIHYYLEWWTYNIITIGIGFIAYVYHTLKLYKYYGRE